MVRVGVYWQEHQNTSAVSSGTQTAHCDWPHCSQELNPDQYSTTKAERQRERLITDVALQPTHTESDI